MAERSALREQYLSNLQLRIENEQLNTNAQKILKNTGQTPSQLTDTRTAEELFKDLVSLKRNVKDFLVASGYLNPRNANILVDRLDNETIKFIFQNKNFILKDFLSKNITPLMFEDFIQEYMLKYAMNAGVEMGIQGKDYSRAPIISNNQILNRLVNQNDLTELQKLIDLFEKNTNPNQEGMRIINTSRMVIGILREKLPTEQFLRRIDSLSEADQFRARQLLSEYLSDVPTREQVIKEARIIDDALNRRNSDMAFGALMRLNNLLAISKGKEEGLGEISTIIGEEDVYDFETGFEDQLDEAERVAEGGAEAVNVSEEVIYGSADANLYYDMEGDYLIPYLNTKGRIVNFLIHTGTVDALIDTNTGKKISKTQLRQKVKAEQLMNETNWKELVGIYIDDRSRIGTKIKDLGFDPVRMTFLPLEDVQEAQVIMGRGLKKSKKEKFREKINFTAEKPKPYQSFGKFYLNKHRLNDGILMIKGEGSRETGFKTRKISNNLKDIFTSLIDDKTPDFGKVSKLTDEDKENLYEAIKISKFDKISIDAPSKTQEEKLSNEFDVLKGSILSGNNSDKAIKRFKFLLVRLMNSKRIPRGQANDILLELAEMGY